MADHLSALPRPAEGTTSNHGLVELMIGLAASAPPMIPEAILGSLPAMRARMRGEAERRSACGGAFRRLDTVLPEISDLMTQAYFTHALVRSA